MARILSSEPSTDTSTGVNFPRTLFSKSLKLYEKMIQSPCSCALRKGGPCILLWRRLLDRNTCLLLRLCIVPERDARIYITHTVYSSNPREPVMCHFIYELCCPAFHNTLTRDCSFPSHLTRIPQVFGAPARFSGEGTRHRGEIWPDIFRGFSNLDQRTIFSFSFLVQKTVQQVHWRVDLLQYLGPLRPGAC